MDLALAKRLQLEIVEDLSSYPLVQARTPRIPYLLAKEKLVLPIEETETQIKVACADPFCLEAIEELRILLRKKIQVVFCSQKQIEETIEKCYQQKEEETKKFFSALKKESGPLEENEGYDLLEQKDQNPVVRMVNTFLLEAISQGASDIHFEPVAEGFSVRYRIDGVLQKRHSPPKEFQGQILARLKVLAQLDIAESRLPQDGRIKLRHGGREIDFRVSTLPVVHGERMVLRILDKGNIVLGLDRIGMEASTLTSFRKLIQVPEGIVLVTGPTGSGKTTTLYSAIAELDASEENIMTIEDPVEYKLSGISQMHVNRRIELDFAKGLRHILRQDPDVILIGEIRDRETAEIAIQSSLTGHLVFSTLHTNDAPSAVTRLVDMGIEPYLIASSVLGVLAQRLIRTLCPRCKEKYTPSLEERKELGISSQELYAPKGCEACFGTGYKGRAGIHELMLFTPALKERLLKTQDAQELRRLAISQKMRTLFDHGVSLVLSGITSSSEVLRATRLIGEEE